MSDRTDVSGFGRTSDWSRVRATVAGFGVTGFAAADNLTHLGATVTALDDRSDPAKEERATLLGVLGADVRLGEGSTAELPGTTDLLVVSPGWRPDHPLLRQAAARGVPVWGEIELAWRLRDPGSGRDTCALAGRHRHQRQDHDRADAPVDPGRRGPAQRRRGNVGRPASRR